ncbi:hypothetical protein [Streptomyces sp. NPDC099088]|uniref:hypothetical protein n=1 Tax=Streptomyces sp. NPDC099088 TaxID=3366101 RepID=UPI00380DB11A
MGSSELERGRLAGQVVSSRASVVWDLSYESDAPPLFLLPSWMHDGSFPKAKSLVAAPNASYSGTLQVDGRRIDVSGWRGSQNHNWGERHTDAYVFGQVAGFDEAEDSFLEVVSASVNMGPVRTPLSTHLVLRHQDEEYAIVSLRRALLAKARYGNFFWDFSTSDDRIAIRGRITGCRENFVALNYYNPPGGSKHCLNTKIGTCQLDLVDKRTGGRQVLHSKNRALMEILTDDKAHGIAVGA